MKIAVKPREWTCELEGYSAEANLHFFYIRVTNQNADTYKNISLEKVYKRHEQEKKRQYNHRIINIEQGTFTPLIFTITGGTGPECKMFHKELAHKIAAKNDEEYGKVITWIRCKLSFLAIKSALMCLRGSRTTKTNASSSYVAHDFDLVCGDLRL